MAGGITVDKTRREEQVYDIKNCGPRHRFCVLLPGGKPVVVHNCVQAIARDILAVVLLREQEAGLDVVFHVHDETITDCPEALPQAEVERLFCQPVEWAPGLPLKGAAYTGNYYYKD